MSTMPKLVYAVILASIIVAVVVTAPVEDIKFKHITCFSHCYPTTNGYYLQVTAIDVEPDFLIENKLPSDITLIGDIEIDPHRNAVLNTKRWSNGLIPYVVSSSYSADLHNKIISAMREIEHDVNQPSGATCIKFVPRTTQANYIDVNPGTGCHSVVGMANKGRQDLSLGRGCESKGIMMHELIHAIGFWHEQSRSDRNNFVNINLSNVAAANHHDFNLLTTSSSNNLNMPYDFSSVMHYGPYEFSVDKTVPVITPKSSVANDLKMGQRLSLSTTDVIKIQRLYGCTEDSSHITTPLQSENTMERCSFGNSLCTLQSDRTADFEWIRASGVSNGGPKVGNTLGADPYLLASSAGHHGVARVITPSFNKGSVCIDFFLYQPALTSYLELVVFGPHLSRQSFKTYHNLIYGSWHHARMHLTVPVGTDFQVSFEAHINGGNVAIDDLYIYHGDCE